jgi:hypothetical protein
MIEVLKDELEPVAPKFGLPPTELVPIAVIKPLAKFVAVLDPTRVAGKEV